MSKKRAVVTKGYDTSHIAIRFADGAIVWHRTDAFAARGKSPKGIVNAIVERGLIAYQPPGQPHYECSHAAGSFEGMSVLAELAIDGAILGRPAILCAPDWGHA